MMVLQLAYELGKFEHEVMTLTPQEYEHWIAFLMIKSDDKKRASRKGGSGGGMSRPTRRTLGEGF